MMAAPEAQDAFALTEDQVSKIVAVKQLFYYPYDCAALSEAHASCVDSKGHWRHCEAERNAMDACVEKGERLRFKLDNACVRWKRLHQSCILHRASTCEAEVERLKACADQVVLQQQQNKAS